MIFRQFTNSTSVAGQLLDVRGALFPQRCLLTIMLKDLVVLLLKPLNDDLQKINEQLEQLNRGESNQHQPVSSQQSGECDINVMSQICNILHISVARQLPLQWSDIRFALWGKPKSKQTTLFPHLTIRQMTEPQSSTAGLSWEDHFQNSRLGDKGSDEADSLYSTMTQRLSTFKLLPIPVPTIGTCEAPSAIGTHHSSPFFGSNGTRSSSRGSILFGPLLSFIINHIAELSKQSLMESNHPTNNIHRHLRDTLSQLILQIESIFSFHSSIRRFLSIPICPNYTTLLLLIEAHMSFQLMKCLASLIAIAEPPPTTTIKTDTGNTKADLRFLAFMRL